MKDSAEMLKAISELAWPVLALLALLLFRKVIAERLSKTKSFEVGPLKLALSESASAAVAIGRDPEPADQQKAIQEQRRIAEVLRAETGPAELQQVRQHMDDLARQYEVLRATRDAEKRQASDAEIVQMNKVVGQMRALALTCAPFWGEYALSRRPGDRLVAVIIAQMSPDPKYLNWLERRFVEERPFVFYHAALALQNMADQCWTEAKDQIIETTRKGLEQVLSFKDGAPDVKTAKILETILQRT